MPVTDSVMRLAIIVSHPIQYYVPLYRRLAARDDLLLKVFYTWHAGESPQHDPGFNRNVAWDIPLTGGYEYELLQNAAGKPGSRHFWGIRNPDLIARVIRWKPDAVHITGYAYASHLQAMREFHRRRIPVLFRGDSHLLDRHGDWRWTLKKALLRRVYSWTRVCLYVGRNNYKYFREFGVPDEKLFYCPHCIEVERFSGPDAVLEEKGREWRRQLAIPDDKKVLLFAGKFEARKRPIELMKAVASLSRDDVILVMAGSGPLEERVSAMVRSDPARFRLLSFQNQSTMPVLYRVGNLFVLPSAHGETWGLAVNEAMASGRRCLVSDKVGCAPDLITSIHEGAVFAADNWCDFKEKLATQLDLPLNSEYLRHFSERFDVAKTENKLMETSNAIRQATAKGKTSAVGQNDLQFGPRN